MLRQRRRFVCTPALCPGRRDMPAVVRACRLGSRRVFTKPAGYTWRLFKPQLCPSNFKHIPFFKSS